MNLTVDLHTHTVASGHAYSTVEELARAAAGAGLEAIAVTDHGPALPGGAHAYHFWNLRVLPTDLFGVRLLRGAEANIISADGALDLDDDLLRSLDLVIASLHPHCGYEPAGRGANTQTVLRALSNPLVHVFGHPGDPLFPLDNESVCRAAERYDVCIELNNSSLLTSRIGGRPHLMETAKALAKSAARVTVNSDAHLAVNIGKFYEAAALAREAGIEEDRILNTSLEKVEAFLGGKAEQGPVAEGQE